MDKIKILLLENYYKMILTMRCDSEADIESYKKYWDQRSNHLREDRQGYVLAMSNEYKNILNADGSMDSADVQQRMRLSKETGEFFTEEEIKSSSIFFSQQKY